MYIVSVISLSVWMKLEFSRQIFEKYSNFKFHVNPSSEKRAIPCGRTGRETDRYDKVKSRNSQFGEQAWKTE
jgi:hypothetical protein